MWRLLHFPAGNASLHEEDAAMPAMKARLLHPGSSPSYVHEDPG